MSENNPLVGFPCIGRVMYFHCASAHTVKKYAWIWARHIARDVQGGCLAFETIRDHREWHRQGKPFNAPEPWTELTPEFAGRVAFSNSFGGVKSRYRWAKYVVQFHYFKGWMGFECEGDVDLWRSEGFPMVEIYYEL